MANSKVTRIMMRNGTLSEWHIADSVASLEVGEIGFEYDTYKMKIGNTTDTVGSLYANIPYFAAGIVSVQGVDGTHEYGLTVDSNGLLELDLESIEDSISDHDSILNSHNDSILIHEERLDTIEAELERIEIDHQETIDNLIDSIQTIGDSITLNLSDSVELIIDSVDLITDNIIDLTDEIVMVDDAKVDRDGDTMTGTLSFKPYGIIEVAGSENIYLEATKSFVNTPLVCRNDLQVDGASIITNNTYTATGDNDIVDVKSLKDINLDMNKPVMRTKIADGGKLFRSDSDPNRIVYRPSVPLQDRSDVVYTALEDLKNNLNPNPDPSLIALIDILYEFFEYVATADSVEASLYETPVEFDL